MEFKTICLKGFPKIHAIVFYSVPIDPPGHVTVVISFKHGVRPEKTR